MPPTFARLTVKAFFHCIWLMLIAVNTKAQVIPSYSVTVSTPQSQGYYFIVPVTIGGGATVTPRHIILDKVGKPVYYKTFQANTGDFKIQKDGRITYSRGNKYYIMDSTFVVKDSVITKNGVLFDGHDLQILSNGHYLLLGTENVTMDLSGYNIFNGNNTGSTTATVKCNVIQEQDAAKNVVFEWHCKDHFSFIDVDTKWLTNPNNVDWTHTNAVEQDADGNFLLSTRHFNEITKIKRSDSTIMWRLGGSANQFTFTNDAGMFKGQHDIRRIANGNITLYDNGNAGPPLHAATAKEYSLNETALAATLAWSYTNNPSTYSGAMGDVQRLSNGNTLVNYGQYIGMATMFNVVTPGGNKVFEIAFTDTLRSYRAFNYLTLPWDLKRPVISCFSSGGQYYLNAGSGHASYQWSNGATTQTIALTTTGDYYVIVPKGQNGFIYSETINVSDLLNPCSAVGLNEPEGITKHYAVYPNPFNNELRLEGQIQEPQAILLIDIVGRVYDLPYKKDEGSIRINTESLKLGIYSIKIGSEVKKLVKSN